MGKESLKSLDDFASEIGISDWQFRPGKQTGGLPYSLTVISWQMLFKSSPL
jgi:hypothetical protein